MGTAYTHRAIETATPLGRGHGPLNHMHSIVPRSIPQLVFLYTGSETDTDSSCRPTKSVPHPFTRSLIKSTAGIWKEYVEHEFVKKLARGTLPRECFLHFVK